MKKNSLYRLSALIYRDDNNSLSRSTTITKIIESFFVIKNNLCYPFKDLSHEIKSEFSLLFHDEELLESIKNKHFLKTGTSDNENERLFVDANICLSEERLKFLTSMQNKNNIYRHIVEFYKVSNLTNDEITLGDYIKLIENFLYQIFIQNLEKSKSIFDKSLDISDLVEKLTFSNDEKILINNFLDFDDSEKDKAIFNIGSWAIEFVTINGEVELDSQLNNITHKTLYLDTNVLFRLIGIDGERRQIRLYNFLQRCKECGQNLKISKTVMNEFHKSFETGIKNIRSIPKNVKYITPIANSIVQHYYKTSGLSINIYMAEIELEFNRNVKDLELEIENHDFYEFATGSERIEIDKCSESIKVYKQHHNQYQSLPDATNIMYVKKLRNGLKRNFNDSMFFFLTVDKTLTKWEQETSLGCPITMRPSDWLTLLLKYISRTTNDYKAFVSFIQTVIQTEQREPDTVMAMLEGISIIADKLENQEELYSTIIALKYDDILAIDSYEGKVEYTRELANTILEDRVKKLEEGIDEVKSESGAKIDKLYVKIEEIDEERKKEILTRKNERIKHILYIRKTEKGKIVTTSIIAALFFFSGIFFLLMTWLFSTFTWNFVYNFYSQYPNDVLTWKFGITGILLVIIPISGTVLWHNFIGEKTLTCRLIKAGITSNEIENLKTRVSVELECES